jgi:hypothetical protein
VSGRSSLRDGEGDDFTRISGIGKVLDRRLHQAGVTSYADLAGLNPGKIASLLADGTALSPGRIGNEDWTGQAAKLAKEADAPPAGTAEEAVTVTQGASASSPQTLGPGDAAGLHYQSFVVRVLLHDADGQIANTTVQHVGSGAERRWPGLDMPGLLNFISAYLSPGADAPLARQIDGAGEQAPPEVPAPTLLDEQAGQPENEPIARKAGPAVAARVAAGDAAPPLQTSSAVLSDVPLTLARDLRVPRSGEPFTVSISLDLADIKPPAEPRIRFSTVVLARPLSKTAAQVVSRGEGIVSSDAPLIKLQSAGLPAGTYRLEALVHLIESHGRSRDLVASVEGGILVVSGREATPSQRRQLQGVP